MTLDVADPESIELYVDQMVQNNILEEVDGKEKTYILTKDFRESIMKSMAEYIPGFELEGEKLQVETEVFNVITSGNRDEKIYKKFIKASLVETQRYISGNKLVKEEVPTIIGKTVIDNPAVGELIDCAYFVCKIIEMELKSGGAREIVL